MNRHSIHLEGLSGDDTLRTVGVDPGAPRSIVSMQGGTGSDVLLTRISQTDTIERHYVASSDGGFGDDRLTTRITKTSPSKLVVRDTGGAGDDLLTTIF